jgi:hypothetical protein
MKNRAIREQPHASQASRWPDPATLTDPRSDYTVRVMLPTNSSKKTFFPMPAKRFRFVCPKKMQLALYVKWEKGAYYTVEGKSIDRAGGFVRRSSSSPPGQVCTRGSVVTNRLAGAACSALDANVPRALPWAVLFGPVGATEQ